jgi:hypothetical protein
MREAQALIQSSQKLRRISPGRTTKSKGSVEGSTSGEDVEALPCPLTLADGRAGSEVSGGMT